VTAQISAESISTVCENDSGNPKETYMDYGEKLALTLAHPSPQAMARVLGNY